MIRADTLGRFPANTSVYWDEHSGLSVHVQRGSEASGDWLWGENPNGIGIERFLVPGPRPELLLDCGVVHPCRSSRASQGVVAVAAKPGGDAVALRVAHARRASFLHRFIAKTHGLHLPGRKALIFGR